MILGIRELPSTVSLRSPLNVTQNRVRLILNDATFYPGSVISGVVILALNEAISFSELFIGIDGSSHSSINGKKDLATRKEWNSSRSTHINRTITLAGAAKVPIPNQVTQPQTLTRLNPGYYTYAFQYTLPLDIPPTVGSPTAMPTPMMKAIGYTSYSVSLCTRDEKIPSSIGITPMLGFWKGEEFAGVITSKLCGQTIKIASYPLICPHHIISASSPSNNPYGRIQISGPATMVTGTEYLLNVSINNTWTKPIHTLEIELKYYRQVLMYPDSQTVDVRRVSLDEYVVQTWISTLETPVQPGTTVTIATPLKVEPTLEPTVHSSLNPCVQSQYRLRVTSKAGGGIFGSDKAPAEMFIYMCVSHPDPTVPVPAEVMGVPGDAFVLPSPPPDLVETALASTALYDPSTSSSPEIPKHGALIPSDISALENAKRATGIMCLRPFEVPTASWRIGQTITRSMLPVESIAPNLSAVSAQNALGLRVLPPI